MFIQSKTQNVILTFVICVACAFVVLLWRAKAEARWNEAMAKADMKSEKCRADSAEADVRHAKAILKIEQDKNTRLENDLATIKADVRKMIPTVDSMSRNISKLEAINQRLEATTKLFSKNSDKYIQVSELIVKNFDKIPPSITEKFIEIQRN